jgi:hypothetical protein
MPWLTQAKVGGEDVLQQKQELFVPKLKSDVKIDVLLAG